jgi:tRNA (cmo5U34)-methyltransferase
MQANAPAPTPQGITIPADWTFATADVAEKFDRHVREQLPWYDLATGLVTHVARHFIPHGGLVYDLGASTGNIGKALAPTLEAREARLVGIESQPAMADAYGGPGKLIIADAVEFEFEPFDVAVAFLFFTFVPVEDRDRLFWSLVENLKTGGALIIVDKQEAPAGYLGTVIRRITLAGKAATGTPAADIVAKELSLSGIQRPVPEGWPPRGREVFRFGEFGGWVVQA